MSASLPPLANPFTSFAQDGGAPLLERRDRSRSRSARHLPDAFSSVAPASVAPDVTGFDAISLAANLLGVSTAELNAGASASSASLGTLLPPETPSFAPQTLFAPSPDPFNSQPSAITALALQGFDQEYQSTTVPVPSNRLGQLLGVKGATIQKIKEVSGVTRLHLPDKDRAKHADTIAVDVGGSPSQIAICQHLLQALVAGDQTELGHKTTHLEIGPDQVGKVMGRKGQTVKELTHVYGCYIEIQQDRDQGVNDRPRLFIAGKPHDVDQTIDLINRFIESAGSRLDAVMDPSEGQSSDSRMPLMAPNLNRQPLTSPLLALTGVNAYPLGNPNQSFPGSQFGGFQQQGGMPATQQLSPWAQQSSGYRPNGVSSQERYPNADRSGPMIDTIIEIPSVKKSHLLGLKGQTIDKVRQMSGVVKCHIQEDKNASRDKANVHVQIVGTFESVTKCKALIEGIVVGDQTGIGHATECLPIPIGQVNQILGHRGQVITLLKNITNIYLDIQQGPAHGVPVGSARLFMAGLPDQVQRARALLAAFIEMVMKLPEAGELNVDVLGNTMRTLAQNYDAGHAGSVPPPPQLLASSSRQGNGNFVPGGGSFGQLPTQQSIFSPPAPNLSTGNILQDLAGTLSQMQQQTPGALQDLAALTAGLQQPQPQHFQGQYPDQQAAFSSQLSPLQALVRDVGVPQWDAAPSMAQYGYPAPGDVSQGFPSMAPPPPALDLASVDQNALLQQLQQLQQQLQMLPPGILGQLEQSLRPA